MGYALIDTRASGGALVEYDTEHCRHCEALVNMQRHRIDGAWCSRCGGPVCPTPACANGCAPFMRRIDAQLRREAFARTAGLADR